MNKITKMIIAFLLLIPFRLPISILMVKGFNYLATLGGGEIPLEVLAWNVTLTKIIYNISLSAWFIYTIDTLSRDKIGRKPSFDGSTACCYWWTLIITILMIIFICFDTASINLIFYKS